MKKNSPLTDTIKKSFSVIEKQIPLVEKEALMLIKDKSADIKEIEYYLDTLYSLHISGFKVEAHKSLIKYLGKLNPKLAEWHKIEFAKDI